MIQVQDLKRIYKQDKELATEIAQVLGRADALKTATKGFTTASKKPAKKAPAKKKPANDKKKEPQKNVPAKKASVSTTPKKKQDSKNNKKKKAAGETQKTAIAEETINDRMFILLRSADVSQRLTGIKKALEAACALLVTQAKQAENYDLIDEIEGIRDRIILHLNNLKKVAKQE